MMTTTLTMTGMHTVGRRVRPSIGRYALCATTRTSFAARPPGSTM